MSDIHETELAYEAACKERGAIVHPMIQEVLTVDREENMIEKKSETMLYLAGNNYLVSKQRLTDDDVDVLFMALSANTYVTTLDLRYNNLTDTSAKCIAQFLQSKSCCLSSLNLMCNDFTEEGGRCLAEALETNTSLKNLRLNGNKFGNSGGLCFAQALQVNVALESLDLADTDLETESLVALATVLNYNQSLKAINVSRPILYSVEEETTDHFARMLKTNDTLQELHLLKHDIRDFGATRLADELKHNFTLTYLALNCNRITRDGARQLAELLKHDTALEVLDLSFNRIGDDGATAIATALALHNTHLKSLSIVTNEISGQGLCDIADSLRKKNHSVNQLFIWGNDLQESCCIALKNLLDIGRLNADDVDYRPYMVGDTVQLAEVTNGLRTYYYRAPAYGDYAQPELARFVQRSRQKTDEDL